MTAKTHTNSNTTHMGQPGTTITTDETTVMHDITASGQASTSMLKHNNDSDLSSLQPMKYLPTSSSTHHTHDDSVRKLTKEDASSIIGGISMSPTLHPNSPRLAVSRTRSRISIPEVILSDDDEFDLDGTYDNKGIHNGKGRGIGVGDELNGKLQHRDVDKNIEETNAPSVNSVETQKVFNFSFPFSSNIDNEADVDINAEAESDASTSAQISVPINRHHSDSVSIKSEKSRLKPQLRDKHDYHRLSHTHENVHSFHPKSRLSKTLKMITNVFNPRKQQLQLKHPVSLPNPTTIIGKTKRPSHPMCPTPPPNVKVYWDDIANTVVEDEAKDRENIRLKLERQLSVDTMEEARYYKDISHLDDGKFKALRQSIINVNVNVNVNMNMIMRSKSDPTLPDVGAINSQLSAVQLDGSATSTDTTPEPSGKEVKALDTAMAHAPTTSSRILSSFPISPVGSLFQHTITSNYDIYDELDGDVIVLGGYRGSILRDSKTKRRTWIPVLKAGLNFKKINLQLGPTDEDELREYHASDIINDHKISEDDPDYPKMYPDGMLTHIGPVDISRRLIKRLNQNPKVNASDWGYDWRLSPDLVSQQLHQELKRRKEESIRKGTWNDKGVLLIAHSMGGIIAHGAMVKDPSLVRGVIYVGTPLPCANILGPLRYTDAILLSKDILTNVANFFMRSSFVFMPPSWGGENENGEEGGMTLFRDLRNGERYKIDFWDPKNWILYNLSPLVSNVRLKHDVKKGVLNLKNIKDTELRNTLNEFLKVKIDPETEVIVFDEFNRLHEPVVSFIESYTYLERVLRRTQKFIKSLEYSEKIKYPPMAQVFSNGVPSVKYSLVDGEECIKRGEYYRFFYGPGDGVVYQGWNFPRERGRKRDDNDESCGKGGVDSVAKGKDWRGREYGYGEKYAYPLCGRFRCTVGHIALLGELDVLGDAISAILDEEVTREESKPQSQRGAGSKDDYAEDE